MTTQDRNFVETKQSFAYSFSQKNAPESYSVWLPV
ncbi:hypothetical protein T03_7549 [Trichinella britovi]|uniref:Uncharacterized protein n=1 Tax=Trichinella britovi TaxID=45882 RepID=A0A0V0YV69_TRIBR|nr:hypothetical protein T03_7549 [Trichinella britovi]